MFVSRVIAIVDDDEAILEATSNFLQSAGYETISFRSGDAVLKYGGIDNALCLLSDIDMPDMNGIQLQRALRAVSPTMPIIMMTALTDEKLWELALLDGALTVLRKPVVGEELLRWIESLQGRAVP